jgi:hypothetical protein
MSAWRKSTFPISGECVEVCGPPAEAGEDWRKASPSVNNGQCLEAGNGNGAVLVRDTADRSGPFLSFPAGAWAAFTAGITGGRS